MGTTDIDRTAVTPALGRTTAWLAKQVELGLADVELSLPQYRVLSLLDEGSAVSSSVARRLAVRPPSVTAVVDGLAARGLVERCPVHDDRRQVSLVLTERGRRVLADADDATGRRLLGIAHSLEREAGERAVNDLVLWQRALVAHHLARPLPR